MTLDHHSAGRGPEVLYPEGLVNWAGHRDGGVRRPFRSESGRPTGEQIETPLVKRLNNWVANLVEGKDCPRVLFLVGGPGNGKTDAVEGCISFFDERISANGKLAEAFSRQYAAGDNQLPPRKVIVDLSSIKADLPENLQISISLVQDATEGDPLRKETPEELLLEDLDSVLSEDQTNIYLCCVNRGVLARAAELAYESPSHSAVSTLLNVMTECVTSSPSSPRCWPLDEFSNIALWPMDVESLVDRDVAEDGLTVGHQIFGVALNESKWGQPCKLNTRCPFCQNRKILSRRKSLDSLIDFLHYYELSSGKRWTFRDLFSLVPYLLVGDHIELEIKGKVLSPCEWASEQYRLSREGVVGTPERDRALYLLMSRLYHHRLFPVWPSFDKGDLRNSKRLLLKGSDLDSGINSARAFFRYVIYNKTINSGLNGDVPARIRNALGPTLDPALALQKITLFSRKEDDISVADVEDMFSLSIRDGIELVGSQLETLESDVLNQLADADESLMEDKFPRNRMKEASLLQSTLRQFASRLTKRSIGTKNGVCRNVERFQQYVSATENTSVINDVRKALRSLLNNSNNQFCAGLATTFGQPIAHKSRDIYLVLDSPINVTKVNRVAIEGRPKEYLPYLQVDKHYVPLTFELFQALVEVNNGLHESSLPNEIYSLLDRVKSLVSGRVVRDPNVLSQDPSMILGISGEVIDYIGGEFIYNKGAA
jgi:hypothetical protein